MPPREDIWVLIVAVVSYFLSHAAAFATGDWHWFVVGTVVGIWCAVLLASYRLERARSMTARCPRCGGKGRIAKED